MELELSHLAAYLPYDLLINCRDKLETASGVMTGIKDFGYKDVSIYVFRKIDFEMSNVKPILQPMSKLTRKELEDAGFRTHIDFLTWEFQKGITKIEDPPHKMVQYLLSQHYDIFGLIEAGLAVEK